MTPARVAVWRGYAIVQEGAESFSIKRGGMVHGTCKTAWACIEFIDRGFK